MTLNFHCEGFWTAVFEKGTQNSSECEVNGK